MSSQRDIVTGKFLRGRETWTEEKWEEGYVDNKGRFRVYRPDYPRAYSLGYSLRAHVVWWLHKKRVHPKNTELHHKDGDRLNDRIENLQPLRPSKHRLAHQNTDTKLICLRCKKIFVVKAWRIRSRPTKFCSQKCFHKYPRTVEHKEKIRKGLLRHHKS